METTNQMHIINSREDGRDSDNDPFPRLSPSLPYPKCELANQASFTVVIFIPNRPYLFGTLRQHIRRAWSSHGSYFGETQSRQNTHGETKRVRYATEPYQKRCDIGFYRNHIRPKTQRYFFVHASARQCSEFNFGAKLYFSLLTNYFLV